MNNICRQKIIHTVNPNPIKKYNQGAALLTAP